MKKQSAYPISDLLKKLNLEPTRENYLAIDRWEPTPQLTGEEEMELPPQFRLRPLKNVPLCSKHVQRVIPFTERIKGEASIEFFNLLNRPNVEDIDHVYGLADFAGAPKFVAPARQIQLSFRITF